MKWWNRHYSQLAKQVASVKKDWQIIQKKGFRIIPQHSKTENSLVSLEQKIKCHIDVQEHVIFPFLKKHIPACKPFLLLFCSEHREMIHSLNKLEFWLDRAKRNSSSGKPSDDVEEINEYTSFLFCLCHHHLTAEDQTLFEKLQIQLTKSEKVVLDRLIQTHTHKQHSGRKKKSKAPKPTSAR